MLSLIPKEAYKTQTIEFTCHGVPCRFPYSNKLFEKACLIPLSA